MKKEKMTFYYYFHITSESHLSIVFVISGCSEFIGLCNIIMINNKSTDEVIVLTITVALLHFHPVFILRNLERIEPAKE